MKFISKDAMRNQHASPPHWIRGLIIVYALAVAPALTAQNTNYQIIELGTLGGDQSTAYGINDAGQVVGQARNADEQDRAFLWQDGTMTDLGTLGGSSSSAKDINGAGQVVGWARNASGERRAFLWQDGTMANLGTLGGDHSEAIGINASGQVVGRAHNNSDYDRAFLWQTGTMTDIGTLGGNRSVAVSINDDGAVVGRAQNADARWRAFIWQSGSMTDLGTLGGMDSDASRIHHDGAVVGWAQDSEDRWRAFLWENGSMANLGSLGGLYSIALDLNSSGAVVGGSMVSSSVGFRAVLWQNGSIVDLNTLVDDPNWVLHFALGINDAGHIVGAGAYNGQTRAFLLRPAAHTFRWVGPSNGDPSGDFEVAEHWEAVDDPEVQRVPGPGDTVVFDLIADPGYVVTLNEDREVAAMRVEQGTLTLRAPTGAVLTVGDATPPFFVLRVGTTPGVRGGLDLQGSTIKAHGWVFVADGLDTDGLLTLREGALLEATQGLSVGHRGTGEVFVLGSELHTSSHAILGMESVDGGGADGKVTVRAGGVWEHAGQLDVGFIGDFTVGELVIGTGGVVTSDSASVGLAAIGRVRVDDPGSQWLNAGDLAVGQGASGEIEISDGARVESGNTWIGEGYPGTVTVTGGGRFEVGDLQVGNSDLGELSISDGAEAKAANLIIGGETSAGPGLLVVDDATLEVGDPLDINRMLWVTGWGDFSLINGAEVTFSGGWMYMGGPVDGDALVLVGEDARLSVSSGLRISLVEPTGPALLFLQGGEVVATTGIGLGPEGRIEGEGTLDPSMIFTPDGNAAARSAAADRATNEGSLVQTGGVISPGTWLATITIEGDFEQLDGVLEMKIAGNEDGKSDRLVVTENAGLAGMIEVFFVDGFAPTQGDAFGFLEVGGAFTDDGFELRLPNLLPGFEYETHFEGGVLGLTALSDGVVFPAPEPLGPAPGEADVPTNPTLSWQSVEGATHYRVQVSLVENFLTTLVDEDAIVQTNLDLDDLSLYTEHFWRVKAFGEALESAWSAVASFTTAPVVSGEDGPPEIAAELVLHPNYPNPFSRSTTIAYTLPEAAHVDLRVFDLLGRRVAVLADGEYTAGRHNATLDANGLASGVYVVRLAAGAEVAVRRVTVVK